MDAGLTFSSISDSTATFYYHRYPEFSLIYPPVGSVVGGESVVVSGSHFPNVSTTVICRWNETVVVMGRLDWGTSTFRCGVPSKFRIRPFSPTEADEPGTPLALEVSFSRAPVAFYSVQTSVGFSQYGLISPQEAYYVLSPKQTLASFGGANITIRGTNFVTGLPEGFALCR